MKPLKLSNKNRIRLYLRLIFLLIALNLLFFAFLFFRERNFSNEFLMKSVILTFTVVLFIVIYRMRYFEYDDSGEIISIRSVHPLFIRKEQRLEFPKENLSGFKIERGYGYLFITLSVWFGSKPVKRRYKIYCVGNSTARSLEHSLKRIKDSYEEYKFRGV